MGGGEAVGDQDDLAVGRVLGGEQAAGKREAVLQVGEVGRDFVFADVVAAHVGAEPHDRVEERDGLGHHIDDAAGLDELGEAVDFDEADPVARVFAADEAFEGQGHALDVDVLAVVAHRAAHVHQDASRALGRVAGAMDLDVVLVEAERHAWSLADEGVDEGAGDVEVGDRVAEFVIFGGLQLDGAFADDRALVAARF